MNWKHVLCAGLVVGLFFGAVGYGVISNLFRFEMLAGSEQSASKCMLTLKTCCSAYLGIIYNALGDVGKATEMCHQLFPGYDQLFPALVHGK